MYRQPMSTPARNPMDSIRPPKPPDRPLVPYMRFSRKMWPQVRAENPDAQLWDIGRIIGSLWKGAPEAERSTYQQEYELEKGEYEKAMKQYHNSPAYKHYVSERNRAKQAAERSANAGRRSEANSGVYIQPVDEEDPYEMTMKRLAAIRYDRNNRLMAELFSSSYLPDTRTIVPQHRIEQLRKQGQQLAVHQTKLNDELKKLEDAFNDRKRAIQSSSEDFAVKLRKVAEERPQLGEDAPRYKQVHEEWQTHLLKAYDEYKTRQEEIQKRQEAERLQAPVLYSLTVEKTPSPPANNTEDGTDSAARPESRPETNDAASEQQQVVTQNGDSHVEENGVNNEDSNSAANTSNADVDMRDDTSTVGGGVTDNDGASEISDANDEQNHSLDGTNGTSAE